MLLVPNDVPPPTGRRRLGRGPEPDHGPRVVVGLRPFGAPGAVVVDIGFGAVVVVVPGEVVDVVDDVDVDVVTSGTSGGDSALPVSADTVGKDWTLVPAAAADMNRRKISAGRLPPLTCGMPCTFSMGCFESR